MTITPAEMQAELGANPMNARVVRADETQGEDTAKQEWYVTGGVDAPGRALWVSTTASDNAATQAAAVLTALRA